MDNHSSFTMWISRFREILKCVGELFSTWRKNKSLKAKNTELLLLQAKREAEKAEMDEKLRASHAEEARLSALLATLRSEKTEKKENDRNKKRNDRFKRSQEVAQVDGKDGITDDTDENISSEDATCEDNDADALVCGSEVGRENDDEGDPCGEDGKMMDLGDAPTKSTRRQEDNLQGVASTDYPLRTCAWDDCGAMETTPKQFQICARCKKMKSWPASFYCGVECQTQDWNTKHKQFHVEESRQLKETKKKSKKEVGDMIDI